MDNEFSNFMNNEHLNKNEFKELNKIRCSPFMNTELLIRYMKNNRFKEIETIQELSLLLKEVFLALAKENIITKKEIEELKGYYESRDIKDINSLADLLFDPKKLLFISYNTNSFYRVFKIPKKRIKNTNYEK